MKLRGTGVGSMFYGVGNTGLPNPAAAFCEVLPDTSVNVTIGAATSARASRASLRLSPPKRSVSSLKTSMSPGRTP